MKTRIVPALLMAALLIPLSSCPRTPQVSLGVWLFNVEPGGVSGIELGPDGITQEPSPYPTLATAGPFIDTASWAQVGSTFTLTQMKNADSDVFVYTGTVDSSTSIINGTWMQTVGGTLSGLWSGMKL